MVEKFIVKILLQVTDLTESVGKLTASDSEQKSYLRNIERIMQNLQFRILSSFQPPDSNLHII